MPELPEVETIRRALAPALTGRALFGAWAFPHPKFEPALDAIGTTVTGVGRHGKYLLAHLDDGRDLVIHLGMTGSPADHVGTLAVQGPDALDPTLTADDLYKALRQSRRAIKTQLLSQRPLAGVGNIYADEALWQARVHPAARTISRAKAAALLDALRDVLTSGLDNGGTTLRDYRTVTGEPGNNQFHLRAYGRAGEPCERCGTLLRRMVLDARATAWCPTCQRR